MICRRDVVTRSKQLDYGSLVAAFCIRYSSIDALGRPAKTELE